MNAGVLQNTRKSVICLKFPKDLKYSIFSLLVGGVVVVDVVDLKVSIATNMLPFTMTLKYLLTIITEAVFLLRNLKVGYDV